jgi:hypothetical protein
MGEDMCGDEEDEAEAATGATAGKHKAKKATGAAAGKGKAKKATGAAAGQLPADELPAEEQEEGGGADAVPAEDANWVDGGGGGALPAEPW